MESHKEQSGNRIATLNHHPRSSDASWKSCEILVLVVFVIPIGFSGMPVGFLPAFNAFKFLTQGRFEEYGASMSSEETRTMGPRLTNNGRMVAIEAAMIPRFNSSLSLFQPQVQINILLHVLTRRTRH